MTKTIIVRYAGDCCNLLFFDDPVYTFYNFLQDSCHFYELNYNDYILRDESGANWPLDSSVYDYMANNKKEISLYIYEKKNIKKIVMENNDVEVVDEVIEDISKVLVEEEKKNSLMDNTSSQKASVFSKEKKATMKQAKENETVLEIQKTFSNTFVHLIIYFYVIYNYLSFNTFINDSAFNYHLKTLVQEKFMKEDFLFNFTIYDYFSENAYNNFTIDQYSQYWIRTNLDEVQEFTQIFEWLKTFFFDKLGFYMKKNQNKKSFLTKYPVRENLFIII